MKIFLSHSSKNKPLVREVKGHLPQHVKSWLDEQEILFGDKIAPTIENAITTKTDYLVIFLDLNSIESSWVIKELKWALAHEKIIGRNFILPIILEPEFFNKKIPFDLGKRKYLTCYDYNESTIKSLSENIISELFALLSRDLDESQQNKAAVADLSNKNFDAGLFTKSLNFFSDLINTYSYGISGVNRKINDQKANDIWQKNLLGMIFDCFKIKQNDVYVIWMRPTNNEPAKLSEFKSKNLSPGAKHYFFVKGEGLAGKVWENNTTAATTKDKPHPWWVYRDDCVNVSYICCPVGNPNSDGGVLAVGSNLGFDIGKCDIEILETFASILTISI